MTWIVDESHRRPTRALYSATGARSVLVLPVELAVLHFTAGGSAEGSIAWLTGGHPVSAHFVLDRDGTLYQLASLDDRTWHAGGASSRWRGKPVNPRSIGIELCNWGPLKRSESSGRVLDPSSKVVAPDRIFEAEDGGLWERYPAPQIEALGDLLQVLASHFPTLRLDDAPAGQLGRLVGHAQVDPKRKIDPGPALDFAPLISRLRAAGS